MLNDNGIKLFMIYVKYLKLKQVHQVLEIIRYQF